MVVAVLSLREVCSLEDVKERMDWYLRHATRCSS
jgi:hypothetical protein